MLKFLPLLSDAHALCLIFSSWRETIRGSRPNFDESTILSWLGWSITCIMDEFVWGFQVLLVAILWLHYLSGTVAVHCIIVSLNLFQTSQSKLLNILVHYDYNIVQYIHMLDKGWCLYDFCSDFLNFNAGNGAMSLNPRPKLWPYLVFFLCCMNFVLYAFCINVLYLCCIFILYFLCCMKFSLPMLCSCFMRVVFKKRCVVLPCCIFLSVKFLCYIFRVWNYVLYFPAYRISCYIFPLVEIVSSFSA